jgi:hypothetical protein
MLDALVQFMITTEPCVKMRVEWDFPQ